MDKVVKINSRQGGPFNATNRLVDFDIPNDGTYDLTDSFFTFVIKAEADNGVFPLGLEYTGGGGAYNNNSLYNVALVKNCSLQSELQGQLEDIRRVDILKQNLNEYTLTDEERRSEQYKSIGNVPDRQSYTYSIFQELHAEGDILSRNLVARVPIKFSQLFELGQLKAYPAQSMGKTRVHLELNLDKLGPVGLYTDAYLDDRDELEDNQVTDQAPELKTKGVYMNKSDSPFFVGMKVELQFGATVAEDENAIVNAQDATQTGAVTLTNASGVAPGTNVARQVLLKVSNAEAGKTIVITGTDESGASATQTLTTAAAATVTSAKYFINVTEVNITDALSTGTLNVGWAEDSAKGVGQNVLVNTITSISFPNGIGGSATLVLDNPPVLTAQTTYTNLKLVAVAANNPTYEVSGAELVLRRLAKIPKAPQQLNYMTFTTEEFNGTGEKNFQRMFQLEPDCVNVFLMFPQELFSHNSDLVSGRLRINNEDLTDRDIIVSPQRSPLYYDRLRMAFMNSGNPLNDLVEQNFLRNQPDGIGGNYGLQILANPTFQSPMEKLLQVNLDVSGTVTDTGLQNLVLFKQVMRGVGI